LTFNFAHCFSSLSKSTLLFHIFHLYNLTMLLGRRNSPISSTFCPTHCIHSSQVPHQGPTKDRHYS
jgi:hypothetical protein